MSACRHETIEQYSTIYARTDWSILPDGTYEPDEAPLTKVLDEETNDWRCRDCGVQMTDMPDVEGKLGAVVVEVGSDG